MRFDPSKISLRPGFGLSACLVGQHAVAADIVYAWADKPNVSRYDASSSYAHNGDRAVPVTRAGKGRYSVDFGQIADVGANVQVAAYGAEAGHCNVMRWSGGKVDVTCIDAEGRMADRRFVAMAVKGRSDDRDALAYAWLQSGTDASYVASNAYRYGNGSMKVARTGRGAYRVELGAPVGQEATVLVTAYNSQALCNVANWGGGSVNIRCTDPNGSPLDSAVSVLAIGQDFDGASFVWNASNSGEASPQYSQSSDGTSQSVTRTGVGAYSVALGPEANIGGHVQAAAYQSDASCWVGSWGGGKVNIRCAKDGNATDSRFVVAGLTGEKPRVVAAAEDCVTFDNASAELKRIDDRWKIVDGNHWMFDFGTEHDEAALAINYIKQYGVNQSCFVGRPDPSIKYLLKDGTGPSGSAPGEDCVRWNQETVEVKFVSGQWKLIDGSHWIAGFPNESEAEQALAVVKQHRFSRRCFVGRPNPSFEYFR